MFSDSCLLLRVSTRDLLGQEKFLPFPLIFVVGFTEETDNCSDEYENQGPYDIDLVLRQKIKEMRVDKKKPPMRRLPKMVSTPGKSPPYHVARITPTRKMRYKLSPLSTGNSNHWMTAMTTRTRKEKTYRLIVSAFRNKLIFVRMLFAMFTVAIIGGFVRIYNCINSIRDF